MLTSAFRFSGDLHHLFIAGEFFAGQRAYMCLSESYCARNVFFYSSLGYHFLFRRLLGKQYSP